MANRTLGKTDLSVSPLCLGGNVFGWTADEQRSFAVLDAYMEGGGNFIDTADTYSTWLSGHVGGESESILGRWMSARKNRGHVILATNDRQDVPDKSVKLCFNCKTLFYAYNNCRS